MYDFPEIRKATNSWWKGIAKHMQLAGVKDVPSRLQHNVPVKSLWQHNDLLLSQCCGFDVVYGFKDSLNVLMITDWAAEGCHDGHYSSWIVVHEDSSHQQISDLYNGVAVINGRESHSGMNGLLALVAPHSHDGFFFQRIDESGAHIDSLSAIQQKIADVTSIDCVTYALLKEHRPSAVTGTRVIGQTNSAPAHPYITRSHIPLDTQKRMRDALKVAFADNSLDSTRETILLKAGIFDCSNDYQKIADDFSYDSRLLDVIS